VDVLCTEVLEQHHVHDFGKVYLPLQYMKASIARMCQELKGSRALPGKNDQDRPVR
jgi:hypothetical protein